MLEGSFATHDDRPLWPECPTILGNVFNLKPLCRVDRFVPFQRISAIQKRVQEISSVQFLNPYILFYISTIFKAVDVIDKTGLSVSLYM